MIGIEEHAWTADLRDALLKFADDDTVNLLSSRQPTDHRLREVGEERLARRDAAGVDVEVLSITTPGTQPLHATEAVPPARDANDFLAEAVRAHPDRFAAFATLPPRIRGLRDDGLSRDARRRCPGGRRRLPCT